MTDTITLKLTWEEAEALNTFLNVRAGFFTLVNAQAGEEVEAAARACDKLHMAVTGAAMPWSEFFSVRKGE